MKIINAHYARRCHPETCCCPSEYVLVDDSGLIIEDVYPIEGESPPLSDSKTTAIREEVRRRMEKQKVYCSVCYWQIDVPAGSCYTCPNCGNIPGACG